MAGTPPILRENVGAAIQVLLCQAGCQGGPSHIVLARHLAVELGLGLGLELGLELGLALGLGLGV